MDAIARDSMAICVRGVGEVPVAGDDHPARGNLMVGHRATNRIDGSMYQAIGSRRPSAARPTSSISDDELQPWAGEVEGHTKGDSAHGLEGGWPAQTAIGANAIHINQVGSLLGDQYKSTGGVNLDLGGIGMGSAQRLGGPNDRVQVPLVTHMEAGHVGGLRSAVGCIQD